MKRGGGLFLKDILSAIDSIEIFVHQMSFEDFSKDDKTSSAVVHKLEIIGEATKNLPRSIRTRNPDVPWREMAGMRDKIAHFYFGLDYEIVWKVVTEQLPKVKVILQGLLDQPEGHSPVN